MQQAEILIREAMTKNVKTISGDAPVSEAAKLMEKNNIGSVVVAEGKKPEGILTERDITYRVVAADKKPSEVKVSEIMSKPVVTVGPTTNITDASKIMAMQNMRRLPVTEKDTIVGIISNKDILHISPGQIEILRELSRMKGRSTNKETLEKGTCENCGDHWVRLSEVNSSFVCDSCRDEMVGG